MNIYVPKEIVTLAIVSWLLALCFFLLWRKSGKPFLVYAHLVLLFLPLGIYATRVECDMHWFTGLLGLCSLIWAKLAAYVIPPVAGISIIVGYFLIPKLYQTRLAAKPLNDALTRKLRTLQKNATFFWFDSAKPVTFTSRNKIFVSVGLFDLLTKKELEAVFLHELYHVKVNSTWTKFSSIFGQFVSPIARFSTANHVICLDEKSADIFASHVQCTERFVVSARTKIREWSRRESYF